MGWFSSSSNEGENPVDRLDPERKGKAYEALRDRAVRKGDVKNVTPEQRAEANKLLNEDRNSWWG